jgi:glycolate oxidase FAD binding subunit
LAEAFQHGRTVVPFGGATKLRRGNPPASADLALGLSGLRAIADYDPGNLVVKVQAGAVLADVRRLVAADNLVLPVGHAVPHRSTIGGCLAVNDHHLKRLLYGRVKDCVLGVTVVLASGERVHFGGATIKNVSGYDVGKLFLGSLGTLGVIVDCHVRLRPAPLAEAGLIAALRSTGDALDAALCLADAPVPPAAVQVLSPLYVALLPKLRSCLRHPVNAAVLSLFEGHADAVAGQLREAAEIARDGGVGGAVDVGGAEGVGGAMHVGGAEGVGGVLEEIGEVQRVAQPAFPCAAAISVPLSAVGSLVAALDEAAVGHDIEAAYRLDCGVGTGEVLARGTSSLAFLRRIRAVAESVGGNLTLLWGWQALEGRFDAWGEPPQSIDLSRRIKAEMDPKSMLNPGRYVGGM